VNVQLIEKDGSPMFAVIPYCDYKAMISEIEDSREIDEVNKMSAAIDAGEETYPMEFVEKLIEAKSKLHEWRKYRGITQVQLAEMANLSQGAVASIESGKRNPNMNTGRRLADALKCDIDDLF